MVVVGGEVALLYATVRPSRALVVWIVAGVCARSAVSEARLITARACGSLSYSRGRDAPAPASALLCGCLIRALTVGYCIDLLFISIESEWGCGGVGWGQSVVSVVSWSVGVLLSGLSVVVAGRDAAVCLL